MQSVIAFLKTQPVYTGTSCVVGEERPNTDGKRPEMGRKKGGEATHEGEIKTAEIEKTAYKFNQKNSASKYPISCLCCRRPPPTKGVSPSRCTLGEPSTEGRQAPPANVTAMMTHLTM